MAKDALAAHAHDELGLTPGGTARPTQAALVSAATFSIGAALPLAMAAIAVPQFLVPMVAAASLVFLAFLGALGALAGGASLLRPTARVLFWGAFAMGVTALAGRLFAGTP